jgi:hypothetical protein
MILRPKEASGLLIGDEHIELFGGEPRQHVPQLRLAGKMPDEDPSRSS